MCFILNFFKGKTPNFNIMKFLTGIVVLCTVVSSVLGEETYTLHAKQGCDMEVTVVQTLGKMTLTQHGTFSKISSEALFSVTRPDLNKTFAVMPQLKTCTEAKYEKPTETTDEYFTHRDEIDWDGKSCYKYYNETSVYIVADKDNLILAQCTNGECANYTQYSFSSVPASSFKMPEEYSWCETKEVYQDPNSDIYTKECAALQLLPIVWLIALVTFLLK